LRFNFLLFVRKIYHVKTWHHVLVTTDGRPMCAVQLASWCGFMVWFILLAVFGLSCFDRRPKDDTEPHSAAITIDVRRCPDELDPLLLQQQQQQQ